MPAISRWVLTGLVVWLSWPLFLASLFHFAESAPRLVGSALLVVGLAALPRVTGRRSGWLRLLAFLPWGPGAPGLAWLLRAARPTLALALVACPVAIWQALQLPESLARQELLFRYKLAQIRRGRLSYYREWGWVDRRHRLSDVLEQLAPGGERQIAHLFFGSFGQGYEMHVRCQVSTRQQGWRVLQQLAERCEAEEQQIPWWRGAGVSAHNMDDLPSVYLTLFQQAYPDRPFAFDSPAQGEQRWWEEGRQVVGRRVAGFRDFEPAAPALRADYQRLFEDLGQVRTRAEFRVEGPVSL